MSSLEKDQPLKYFEEFLSSIKFWQPTCIVVDWKDIQQIDPQENKMDQGGFGTLRLVKVPQFSQSLVLKILEQVNWIDQDDVTKVVREIQFLHSCNHPNILPLFGLAVKRKQKSFKIGILTPRKWGSLAHFIKACLSWSSNRNQSST